MLFRRDEADAPLRPEDIGFQKVFDAFHDGLALVDAEGHIMFSNAAATRMLGHLTDEAQGMHVGRVLPSAEPRSLDEPEPAGDAPPLPVGGPHEMQALRTDGRHIWVDVTFTKIEHDDRPYVLLSLRDVTERVEARKRAEAERMRLQDAVASLDAFTRVVGHDLKEPVRGMGFYLRELEEDPAAPEATDLIHRSVQSHADLVRLLDGLLEWGRTATTPIEPEALDLAEVLASPGCAAQWENLARERRAHVIVSPDIPPVLATESLLCRAFGNLITNAIRHNPAPEPRVTVARGDAPSAEQVEVVLRDDGPGFPGIVLDAFGSDIPSSIKRGFGLAIARRAIERLDGELRLENDSESGGGIARVRLPSPSVRRERHRHDVEERIRQFV